MKAVTEHKPDLIFLDVQMPKLSGFDVLELIEGDIAVIFTTAYDQYAMKAFEVHAVDYLLKPIGGERFEGALDRAKHRIANKPQRGKPSSADERRSLTQLRRDRTHGPRRRRSPAAALSRAHRRPRRHARYADSDRQTRLRRSSGRLHRPGDAGAKHLKQQTIASIETGLDPARFVRIHRSYIVNFERVVRIEPYGKDSRLAILADGTRLPVSRTGYARLKSLLDDRA